ncbi:MAG TPA: hypothetical protein VGM16_08325 [Gammaproteobacteria bacterium]|jgi:hypothetical protein
MNKLLVSSLMAGLVLSAQVGAAETAVDFRAGLNNYTQSGTTSATLVADATFTDLDLAALGSYTFSYHVQTCDDPATVIFDGSLTIVNGQSQVSVGKQKTGKFVLSYDANAQKLVARFTLDPAIPCYNVVGQASLGPDAWQGQIEVIRNHVVF